MARRSFIVSFAIVVNCAALLGCAATADRAKDRQAVEKLLRTYETGINTDNVDLIMSVYAEDAVWIPSHVRALSGKAAIEARYRRELDRIYLKKTYHLHEIVIAGHWGFIRATSEGIVGVKATGQEQPESHDDFFIVQKRNGTWSVTRYIYNNNLSGPEP
ncbi:MAG: nuclear transport factor 2 family protein [Acidobacteria bacterium]|nr:nuclear transport factor 2 family protein [Acidobacteriota bacterium]